MKAKAMIIESVVIVITTLVAMIFSSCTIRVSSDKDNGPKITKEYNLKDFTQMLITGSATVEYVQDSVYSVSVEDSEKALEDLDIKVKEGTLVVGKKDKSDDRHIFIGTINGQYKVTVHSPELVAVTVAGAGEFKSEKIAYNTLQIQVNGSGDIDVKEFEGNSLKAQVAGSGDINLGAKNVAETEIAIAGSGDINANFTDCGTVKANIAGSGDITLSGNVEKVETGIAGSGNINQDNLKTK